MTIDTSSIVEAIASRLAEKADAAKAEKMAAYIKTDMPFYGVQAKVRDQIVRAIKRDIHLDTRDENEQLV